ncbi:MAG: type II secretion system GspH family protein [Candidatus Omnitrophica bacterium]|nr:type II secretion system GspH family protein [Candidatus Omnitrophota bacterium]MBU4457984.1 type II secretion system GspH family protein [Candidatus Omnitrophota bacterium]
MLIKLRQKSGFTLFELVMAVAILVVAITGILAIFAKFIALNEDARNLTLALTACQDKMEEIRNSNFDTVFANYNATSFDPDGFTLNEAKGAVYVNNTNPELLETYLSVSWRGISNRIIGEDTNLNGALDLGEDLNGDTRLNSPAEISTLMSRR